MGEKVKVWLKLIRPCHKAGWACLGWYNNIHCDHVTYCHVCHDADAVIMLFVTNVWHYWGMIIINVMCGICSCCYQELSEIIVNLLCSRQTESTGARAGPLRLIIHIWLIITIYELPVPWVPGPGMLGPHCPCLEQIINTNVGLRIILACTRYIEKSGFCLLDYRSLALNTSQSIASNWHLFLFAVLFVIKKVESIWCSTSTVWCFNNLTPIIALCELSSMLQMLCFTLLLFCWTSHCNISSASMTSRTEIR